MTDTEMTPRPPAIFIMGPTASGKTALAIALRERLPVELISVDSALIYRGMDIGTAKPSAAALTEVPHHLIDIRDPVQRYSAAEFADDARRLTVEIQARGRVPLIVGGTFLYMRALLQGLSPLPKADHALRAELESEAARQGWPALHARLAGLDAESARRIHPNDAQRIQRALEIALRGPATRSAAWQQAHAQQAWAGPVLKLAILPADRQALREDIARRFHQMMAQGLLDEVKSLYARPDLHLGLPSIRSVGYRQLWQHLAGEMTLDEAVQRAIIATRQYAKRQMTWLRGEPDMTLLPSDRSVLENVALQHFREFMHKA